MTIDTDGITLFQSTPPARGATPPRIATGRQYGFQSTPPARGGDCAAWRRSPASSDFNPRPPRGGRLRVPAAVPGRRHISIHAPREGGDPSQYALAQRGGYFNLRPPRGGRRSSTTASQTWKTFQSTPPARGATGCPVWEQHEAEISIHAPREGGDVSGIKAMASAIKISIHAPREGGDSKDAQFYLRIFDK